MARTRFFDYLFPKEEKKPWLQSVVTGSLYRLSDIRSNSDFQTIKTQIQTMRALAQDSQIATALSYYATDATVTNQEGNVIWADPIDDNSKEVANIVNDLLKRWDVNAYARDHILELATVGNLYIPTTDMYKDAGESSRRMNIALDNNTILNEEFDIIPSYKIDPETVVHLYQIGKPFGYIVSSEDDYNNDYVLYPESSIIHFSLGGLLGEYKLTVDGVGGNDDEEYDIKFAQPLMERATQPTQTLALLEDAYLLSSLSRVVRFVGVECGNMTEEEMQDTLLDMKSIIEQQFSLNTRTGMAQSAMNPQSPNNLIYLPMENGAIPVNIIDLQMSDLNEADNNLLNHYQDKKLSVLGVPKEAMNFSSNEGLGGAGSVLSQRSALYANSLQRLETAYITGWKDAINKYFIAKHMSGMVDQYVLKMQPILTPLSTVISEKKDAAVSQAEQFIALIQGLGVSDSDTYKEALSTILSEEFPEISSQIMEWGIDLAAGGEQDEF